MGMQESDSQKIKDRESDFTPLVIIAGLMACFYIMSNVMSVKIIGGWGHAIVDAGTLTFPLTYILGDIISEIWGFKTARKIILVTFICNIIFVASTLLVVFIPSPSYLAESADAYNLVFGAVPRIIAGSLCAYLVGELTNAWLLIKIRKLTKGRFLWMRTIGSTAVGYMLDTLIFCTIAFAGTVKTRDLFIIMAVNYIVKMTVETFIGTPICYAVCGFLRRRYPKYKLIVD